MANARPRRARRLMPVADTGQSVMKNWARGGGARRRRTAVERGGGAR